MTEETGTKKRSTKPAHDRVEMPLARAEPSQIERCISELRALLDRPGKFAGRAVVDIGGDLPLVVDGRDRTVERGGDAELHLEIHARDLLRLIRRDLEPRQALLYGQIQIKRGAPRDAIAFGDFLNDRVMIRRPSTTRDLPTPTRDLQRARDDLQEFGYCLVADALTATEMRRLRKRVIEQATAELELGLDRLNDGAVLLNESGQRVWNLPNKGQEFLELLENPLIDEIVLDVLGDHYTLTHYTANIATPNNTSSFMHCDQIHIQPPIDVPMGINVLWFLDDISEANGGTRILPGSHRLGVAPADVYETDYTVAAAGPAGTALFLDTRLWHAVGRNRTDRNRHLIVSFFSRSYIRGQENYFLSLLPEVEAKLSEKAKVLFGYRCTLAMNGVEGPVEGKFVRRPNAPIGKLTPRVP